MILKTFIDSEIINIKKDSNEIYKSSMKIYYKVLDNITTMNNKRDNPYTEDELHNLASSTSDSIEILLSSLHKQNKINLFTNLELSDIIYQTIISNIKYLYKLFL